MAGSGIEFEGHWATYYIARQPDGAYYGKSRPKGGYSIKLSLKGNILHGAESEIGKDNYYFWKARRIN